MKTFKCKVCGKTSYSASSEGAKCPYCGGEVEDAKNTEKVRKIWERMNRNERFGCKFSLFPHWVQEYDPISTEETVRLMELSEQETGKVG